MDSSWIKLSDKMPPPGKTVWVLRRWVPLNSGFGTSPRSEICQSRRIGESPLIVAGALSSDCFWHDEGSSYNDQTVAGWREIPSLDELVRAVNAHDDLVEALRGCLRRVLEECSDAKHLQEVQDAYAVLAAIED